METVCHACGYQRKATDRAPDWACPSCGKAYAKTSHDSPVPSITSDERSQMVSGNRLTARLPYKWKRIDADFGEKRGGSSNHEWRFRAVMGILFVWAISILISPSAASVVGLHGEADVVMFMLLALAGVALVIRPLSVRVDMNSSWSRFALSAKFSALFCTVLFIALAIPAGNTERTEVKIQNNGQRAIGDVVRIYTGRCSRGGSCMINVEYAFTPTPQADRTSPPIHGDAVLSGNNRRYNPDVVYARTNKQVPIAYEVDHPELSALNFNDDVFRVDHVKTYRDQVAILGKLFLGVFIGFLAIAGFVFWLIPGARLRPD